MMVIDFLMILVLNVFAHYYGIGGVIGKDKKDKTATRQTKNAVQRALYKKEAGSKFKLKKTPPPPKATTRNPSLVSEVDSTSATTTRMAPTPEQWFDECEYARASPFDQGLYCWKCGKPLPTQ